MKYLSADEIVEHQRLTGASPPPSRIRPVDPSGWVFPGTKTPFPTATVKFATCYECVRANRPDAREKATEFEAHLRTEHAMTPSDYIDAHDHVGGIRTHFPVWHLGSDDM